jgi:leucyl-tRNA synthetase
LQEKISPDKKFTDSEKIEVLIHKTIKKVSDDIEEMKFNTAISAMMIVVNEFEKEVNILPKEVGVIYTTEKGLKEMKNIKGPRVC